MLCARVCVCVFLKIMLAYIIPWGIDRENNTGKDIEKIIDGTKYVIPKKARVNFNIAAMHTDSTVLFCFVLFCHDVQYV